MKPYLYRKLIRAVNESTGASAFEYEALEVNVVNNNVDLVFIKTNKTSLRANGNQYEVVYVGKTGLRPPEGIEEATFKRATSELIENRLIGNLGGNDA